VFCGDPERARSLVRFALCEREEVINEAAARLATLRRPHPTA
jgi:N-succinyldiaminopimelate aminotransferase